MGKMRKGKWADVPPGHHDPVSYAVTARDRSVIDMVEAALRHRNVMLAFQPVVLAQAPERIAFTEGLIRVLDETGRIIPAREFIHVVENAEIGRIIDCLALEQGLKALSAHPELRLSVNMSARSIGYGRWIRILKRGLGLDPTVGERLILEVTENSAMLVPELVTSFMADMQRKGISFALDDFGAGFSSFSYLKDFYFDMLKIDGQFIRGIAQDPDNQVITGAIVSLARQFDLLSVAENVEKAEDAAYLRAIGVDCLQGYYYGAPTVRPDWLREAHHRDSA